MGSPRCVLDFSLVIVGVLSLVAQPLGLQVKAGTRDLAACALRTNPTQRARATRTTGLLLFPYDPLVQQAYSQDARLRICNNKCINKHTTNQVCVCGYEYVHAHVYAYIHIHMCMYIYIYVYSTPPNVPTPFFKISASGRRGLLGSGECL